MSLVWFAQSVSTVVDVYSNAEGGGRFAGGRSRLLPTAQRDECSGMKRLETSHDETRRIDWLRRLPRRREIRRQPDLGSRFVHWPTNGKAQCCRCTSTRRKSIVASC